MRIRIDHSTTYHYDSAARFVIQLLRLTPRSSDAQHVHHWHIETDIDARLRRSEDAFGNIVHTFYSERPVDSLTLSVTGEVSTLDTQGVLPAGNERLPPLVFLRDTPLTRCDAELGAFADALPAGEPLARLHALMQAVHRHIAFDVAATTPAHSAAEAFALGRGVCQDHTHVFIAAARRIGIPARYVSGHLLLDEDLHEQDAAHAWAEAHIDGLGWVGFDAANGICPTERYVRVACGLDYLGAAPVRGANYGGSGERLVVRLNVREVQAMQQRQQQA